jgi:hypothetical protein
MCVVLVNHYACISGEYEMESGEWRVESRVESRERKVDNEVCLVEIRELKGES